MGGSSELETTPRVAPLPAPPSATSRRLVIPCWTHDETMALIDAYREKWYALRRGHLRASHWAEVAEGVRDRCHRTGAATTGFKTAVQCRHKVEKLRQRYRQETHRLSRGGKPSSSSWIYFKKMDAMEFGGGGSASSSSSEKEDFHDQSAKVDTLKFKIPRAVRSRLTNGSSNGVPCEDGQKLKKGSFVWEMVSAVRMMGDEFSRIEEMKMKMAKDMEKVMREIELKRTRMILDSQRQLAEYIRGLHEKSVDEVSPKL
ncbi:trihelix transcription factor ENAP2-like [Wolffia australiana]